MLLGFQYRFGEPIIEETKEFTLRNKRKVMPKIGERLYMYTALRTKYTKKLTDKYTLKKISKVRVMIRRKWSTKTTWSVSVNITYNGKKLSLEQIEDFVVKDGFESTYDFAAYWLGDKPKTNRDSKSVKNKLGAFKVMFQWTDLNY